MEKKTLPKYVIYDVVFEGMSLNYDQGIGNIQELKKIVMPNGLVHTIISRYALRYSLLETLENLGKEGFAKPDVFIQTNDSEIDEYRTVEVDARDVFIQTNDSKKKNKSSVIQVDFNKIIDGTIFKYPEFCLFGFLVTDPQIQRENPVKISHAISLTPFSNDILLYANHSFARRYIKKDKKSSLEPSLFNKEEHYTYYGYTVVVDVDKIKHFEFHLNLDDNALLEAIKNMNKSQGKVSLYLRNNNSEEELEDVADLNKMLEEIKAIKYETKLYTIEINKNNANSKSKSKNKVSYDVDFDVKLKDDFIESLLNSLDLSILHLKRNHQGRQEDLKPKIMIKQVIYNDQKSENYYQTYLNRIRISNTYSEQLDYSEEKKSDNTTTCITKKQVIRGLEFELPISKSSEFKDLDSYVRELLKNSNNANNKSLMVIIDGVEENNASQTEFKTWSLNSRFVAAKLKIKLLTQE
ncbi:MAG: type I-B CRISPR-associated protein Cas7/Cst2/DevR [Candidatus Anstonellales archaeon]